MNTNATKLFISLILTVALLVFSLLCTSLNAQQSMQKNNSDEEKKAIETLKKDGVSDTAINKWILERKLLYPNGGNTIPFGKSKPPAINATGTCSDMGGEGGWGVWQASTGDYSTPAAGAGNTMNGTITWNATNISPTTLPLRFAINTGAGVDPCTPGGGGPPVPYVAPAFGNASIQMGQTGTNGTLGGCNKGCVERLTYSLQVTQADTNFIYAYAIILENPCNSIHHRNQVPFAEIYILDQNGDTVHCSHHKYLGDTTGSCTPSASSGMYAASCTSASGNGMDVAYQPWTIYGINLVSYIGQTVTVVLTNSDCALGGHFCYSYWDFLCPPVSGSVTPFCLGQQCTLTAPPSIPGVQFTYTWYQNHNLYTGPPSASSQTITPTPLPGDTFKVYIQEASGCNFWMPFVPIPTTVIPDFTHTGSCGDMTFNDISTVSPISPTDTVAAWNWQFPGGTPANSTLKNPGTITYPPGTYTVTLIATSSAGCSDTIKHSFTVGGFPTAAFQPSAPCLGTSTILNNQSISPQGDPITSWNWAMAGGNPTSATTQNTSTTYNTAGTHTVTLIVTTQSGCRDTITQQVIVYNPPIAIFNDKDSGCAPVCHTFTDLSQSVDGNITNWAWSFPGGSPSSSTLQNPGPICYNTPGNYNGSIIVTTNYGCKDSLKLNNIIHVYAWPHADFCISPDQAPVLTPVFNFCDQWSSDVVHWTWNFGDNSPIDSVNMNPVHSYSATANANDFYSYNVCINVQNQYGCWDTICKTVELLPEFEFYIPNCFTPNGDGTNELFFGKSRGVKDYNIWLFDRWGNQIWDCHYTGKNTDWDGNGQDGMSSACKWDGIVKPGGTDMNGNSNQLAQEDVYVWKVHLTDIFNKIHNYIGHVTIVK